jgi:hypothetical protein
MLFMEIIKKFEHDEHAFEVHLDADQDGWQLKLLVDGKPTLVNGSISHEVAQDPGHYGLDDLLQIIANAIQEHVQSRRT